MICILKLQYKGEIYPEPGGSQNEYTQAISLLSFMQKTMQKLVARNIKDDTLGHVLYIFNNLSYKPGKSTETAMHHMTTHIQEAVEKTK